MRAKFFPIDITMLAWPGWRGELARRRWAKRYGAEDLIRFQARAEERHQKWTARNCILTLVKSTRDPNDIYHTYVDATCKEHGLHANAEGYCPKC